MSQKLEKRTIEVQIRDSDRKNFAVTFDVSEPRHKYHFEYFDIWHELMEQFEKAIERILKEKD